MPYPSPAALHPVAAALAIVVSGLGALGLGAAWALGRRQEQRAARERYETFLGRGGAR